jgi:tRNA threonylcarbamoyladenosine biosynthesis protein TsaB
MYLLSIDTATNSGGVAIARNSEVIGLAMLKTPLRYSENIIHYIDFLLHQLELDRDEIDCLVVTTGPGSFTGLRIGIATAKGMCQGLGRPVIGISTLEALAHRFRAVSKRVAPMIDARRQQVYGAVYETSGRELQEEVQGIVLPPAVWLKSLPDDDYLFVGDAAQMYSQTVRALKPNSRMLPTDNCVLRSICQLGFRRYTKGTVQRPEELKANYIRPSDAELKN